MIPKSTRAAAERCISISLPFPSIKEHTSFTTKSIDRDASGLRASGETRATHKEEDCIIYKTPQKQRQRAGFVPSWCSVTKTEAKPSTGMRQACESQAKRVLYTKKKRRIIVHALRYPSLRIQRAGFVPSWCSVIKPKLNRRTRSLA
jgi:hypothetical protein